MRKAASVPSKLYCRANYVTDRASLLVSSPAFTVRAWLLGCRSTIARRPQHRREPGALPGPRQEGRMPLRVRGKYTSDGSFDIGTPPQLLAEDVRTGGAKAAQTSINTTFPGRRPRTQIVQGGEFIVGALPIGLGHPDPEHRLTGRSTSPSGEGRGRVPSAPGRQATIVTRTKERQFVGELTILAIAAQAAPTIRRPYRSINSTL